MTVRRSSQKKFYFSQTFWQCFIRAFAIRSESFRFVMETKLTYNAEHLQKYFKLLHYHFPIENFGESNDLKIRTPVRRKKTMTSSFVAVLSFSYILLDKGHEAEKLQNQCLFVFVLPLPYGGIQ